MKRTIYLLASTPDPEHVMWGGHRNTLFYLELKKKVDVRLVGVDKIPKVVAKPGDILWFFGTPDPTVNRMLFFGQEHGAKLVYDMVDDWETLGWGNPDVERELVKRADLVFVVSPFLEERCKPLRPQGGLHLVPNGFAAHYAPCRRKPKNKDFLYAGSLWAIGLESWVRFHTDVCAHPEMVMPMIDGTGPKLAYPQLNTFLKHGAFNVGVSFFQDKPFNRARSPLKFYNYLYHQIKVWAEVPVSGWESVPNVYFLPFTQENAQKILATPFIPMPNDWLKSNTFAARSDEVLRIFQKNLFS